MPLNDFEWANSAWTRPGRYLFPGLRALDRPMSENTINAALPRLGYD